MFSRLFRSTLFILLAFAFGAAASPVDLHHVVYVKHKAEPSNETQTTVSKSSNQSSVVGLMMGDNSAVHLSSQNYRPAHVAKSTAIINPLVFVCVGCSKYISHSSEVSFSRFRKLVLFPFHAFW